MKLTNTQAALLLYKSQSEYIPQRFSCCFICFCFITGKHIELNEVIHLQAKEKYSETLSYHFRGDGREETVGVGKRIKQFINMRKQ